MDIRDELDEMLNNLKKESTPAEDRPDTEKDSGRAHIALQKDPARNDYENMSVDDLLKTLSKEKSDVRPQNPPSESQGAIPQNILEILEKTDSKKSHKSAPSSDIAKDQAEREAREQAQCEAREQTEREEREQAQREAREQAEHEEREQAEREAREKAEREERESAEPESADQSGEQATESSDVVAEEDNIGEAAESGNKRSRKKKGIFSGIRSSLHRNKEKTAAESEGDGEEIPPETVVEENASESDYAYSEEKAEEPPEAENVAGETQSGETAENEETAETEADIPDTFSDAEVSSDKYEVSEVSSDMSGTGGETADENGEEIGNEPPAQDESGEDESGEDNENGGITDEKAEDSAESPEDDPETSGDDKSGDESEDSGNTDKKGRIMAALESILDENPAEITSERREKAEPDEPDVSVKKRKKGRFKRTAYTICGVVMTLFAIIGLISTVLLAVAKFRSFSVAETKREAFTKVIYPAVIMDIEEFDSPSELSSDQVVSVALWSLIMYGDCSKYEKTFDIISVPAVDVEAYAVQIFGDDLPQINHTTVGSGDTKFYYNDTQKCYNVPVDPITFTYEPSITYASKSGNEYTVKVDYMKELPAWMKEKEDYASDVSKTAEFRLIEKDGTYMISSMKVTSVNSV